MPQSPQRQAPRSRRLAWLREGMRPLLPHRLSVHPCRPSAVGQRASQGCRAHAARSEGRGEAMDTGGDFVDSVVYGLLCICITTAHDRAQPGQASGQARPLHRLVSTTKSRNGSQASGVESSRPQNGSKKRHNRQLFVHSPFYVLNSRTVKAVTCVSRVASSSFLMGGSHFALKLHRHHFEFSFSCSSFSPHPKSQNGLPND
jgi:hypothetical protein